MSQAGKDFSGQNLRGRSFKGQDLTGANFGYADIRGANFSEAILRKANFTGVTAGLQKRWRIIFLTICFIALVLLGLTVGSICAALGFLFSSQDTIKIITGIISVSGVGAFFVVFSRQGLNSIFVFSSVIVTISATLIILLNGINEIAGFSNSSITGNYNNVTSVAENINTSIVGNHNIVTVHTIPSHIYTGAAVGFVAIVIIALLAYIFLFSIALIIARANIRLCIIISFIVSSLFVSSFETVKFGGDLSLSKLATIFNNPIIQSRGSNVSVTGNFNSFSINYKNNRGVSIIITFAISACIVLVGIYVNRCSLKDDMRFSLVKEVAVIIAVLRGTSFWKADLVGANFMMSTLINTDFREAILDRIYLKEVKKFDCNCFNSIYLKYSRIQRLLITGQGQNQSFEGLDLKGINLKNSRLEDATFIGVNLNGANLKGANLSGAKLKQAQLDGADLTGATLTGAFIEDWGITAETKLDKIHCRYVYMRVPTKEDPDPIRKPDNRNEDFKDGDFADFIRPLTDTLDLYHNQGVDPRAIAIAFKDLAEKHPDAELEIVAMEKKARDKFLLRAKTAITADKSELSVEYFSTYNQIKAMAEAEVKAVLGEKDNRIQSLEAMVVTALQSPSFYSNFERTDSVSNNPGGISQSVSGGNVYGGLQAIQGNNNIQSQEIHSTASSEQGLTQDQVVELFSQLESVIHQSELPGEVQAKAVKYLDVAKEEVTAKQPDKQLAARNLKRMAEAIESTSKTIEGGEKIWEATNSVLASLLPWLGVAKSFFGF